jgi:hypothetical protein
MKSETILVTPKVAEEWLAKNTSNRPLRDNYALFLAEEMVDGRWRQNTGETIKFSKSEKLLDGQHRLQAVVVSGISIRFDVVFGLDDSIMDVIDTGLKRTAGDVLSLRGATHATLKASIVKSYMSSHSESSALSAGYSNRKIEQAYLQDREFWDNVTAESAKWQAKFKGLSGTFFGHCFATILKNSKHPTKAIPFFIGLASGKETEESVLNLRNKLINNKLSRAKLPGHAKIDLIRTHWNAYVKGAKHAIKAEGWL